MSWSHIWRMSAIIGQDWRPKTARELFIQWQAYLLERWQHTAAIRMLLSSGKRTTYSDYHPFINPELVRGSRMGPGGSTGGPLPKTSIFS